MTQKDVKKRDVMDFKTFTKAYLEVTKSVMTKSGENPDPAAHAIKGEDLYVRNDANPYKAMGIPHDEKQADINNNVNANQVDVYDDKHDGKDQGGKEKVVDKGPDKKEIKAGNKDVASLIANGVAAGALEESIKVNEGETIESIEQEITKLEKENAEGYAEDIKKLKLRLTALKLLKDSK